MRLIFLIAFVFVMSNAYAQQIFQGTIVYKYHFPQLPYTPQVTVFYGPNKLKIKFKEDENFNKGYFLIDLDSGKSYSVDEATKTFFVKELIDTNRAQSTTKTIAGHKTNSIKIKSSGFSKFGAWSSGDIILFTASDLYYPIPQKYNDIPELIMIQNNHIVLGAKQSLDLGREVYDSIEKKTSITIEAIKINEGQINLEEFSIPIDFKELDTKDFKVSEVVLDPVYETETDSPPPPPINKNEKNNSSKPRKTTPTKTEAIKPKKTQTKS